MTISDLVLYKDHNLIILNKPAGMPVQNDKSKDTSLLQLAIMYAKTTLFLINRLDRPTSGIVMMAKKKEIQTFFASNDKIKKEYLAVVKKGITPAKNTLTHYLKKDGRKMRAEISETAKAEYKESILDYEIVKSMDNYDLLKIELRTGRFHQIRAQLSNIGHPIKGDVKYHARRKNSDRSIHLHAYQISFQHPKSKKQIEITAPIPQNDGLWKSVAELMQ